MRTLVRRANTDDTGAQGPAVLVADRPPLAGHEVSRSVELDEFRDRLNGVFYPATVETLGTGARLRRPALNAAALPHVTVGYVRFGADVSVDPGEIWHSYHVNVPLSGHVDSECGRQSAVATPWRAAVFTPTQHHVLRRWSADAAQLCMKIDRGALEAELESLLGHAVVSPIRFLLPCDLTGGAAQGWLDAVRLLIADFERAGGLLAHSAPQAHLEHLILTGLLLMQQHDYSEALHRPRPPARPRAVRRALDLIEGHPEQPLTLGSLAVEAGVSARALQAGFRHHLGMSPITYLREARLMRARRDLTAADGTVTEIAYRWGFTHLGRFSLAYRRRFGVPPVETLAAARARGGGTPAVGTRSSSRAPVVPGTPSS